jgi:lipid-binding SYLF domain-containing protein
MSYLRCRGALGCALVIMAILAGTCLATTLKAQDNVDHALAEFEKADSGMAALISNASGYAIFPSVGKAAIGIGGARGKGWVYDGGNLRGQTTLTQVTIGLQLGGQAYRELILFQDRTALDDFCRGNFELDAQVSAVAVTAGASANAKYNGGVAIFTMAKGGLMYEASVGGQKFSFKPAH